MAEVSQTLRSGAYRLSALNKTRGRSVRSGESPGSLLACCRVIGARTCGGANAVTAPRLESHSKATQCQAETLSRLRKSESPEENGALPSATSGDLEADPCVKLVPSRESVGADKTPVYPPAGAHPLLQVKLLGGRRSVHLSALHPDTFRSPQQLRALCTIILTAAGRLRLHPDALRPCTTSRCYSWRGNNATNDTPPLYRSRTAYYDILHVSPSATQSQIKTAYYKQSLIHHTDKNTGSEEAVRRFSEISEAYTVLGSISLRRKYDRGVLSSSDVQGAGRPSSREATGQAAGPRQHTARRFSQSLGKTMFDFDAFYQAHYGEQLQREREARARKQHLQEKRVKELRRWRQGKMLDLSLLMLLTAAALLLGSLSSP